MSSARTTIMTRLWFPGSDSKQPPSGPRKEHRRLKVELNALGAWLWLVFVLATMAAAQVKTSGAGPSTTDNTPFQHVVIVIQENRTPTNLFQDPVLISNGAHIVQSGSCHGTAIPLTPWQLDSCFDMSHAHTGGWEKSYDNGLMDGACDEQSARPPGCDAPLCPDGKRCPEYTYVPNLTFDGVHGILDPYYQVAEQYGFANLMFQTNQGPSFPAHQFLFSGTSAPTPYPDNYYDWFAAENYNAGIGVSGAYGCIAQAGADILEVDPNGQESAGYNGGYPCYDHNTMPDLLATADPAISWRYYGEAGAGSLWNAPNAISHICEPSEPSGGTCTGPDWTNGDVSVTAGQVLKDIANCQLPQVDWVTPDGNWSDHPGGGPGTDGGPSWIAAIVNAIGTSTCPSPAANWSNTAILITWDDWGGFYDDVNPAQYVGLGYKNGNGNGQQYVYGFRVPLVVVSAYTKRTPQPTAGKLAQYSGYISNTNHDFGSILNFIEYVFGQNGKSLGTIGPPQWPYADYFAPDAPPTDPASPFGLSDFFNFNQSHPFGEITGAKYAPSCFNNPTRCFSDYPMAPDNDVYGDISGDED